MSGLLKLRRSDRLDREDPVWMALALQAFSGDVCGLFSQNSRVSGLFMFRHCLHWPWWVPRASFRSA